MKKRTIYIRREKTIETVGNYRIIKTITRDRKKLYRAFGKQDDGWTWSTPLYNTYEECRQAVDEQIRFDAMPRTNAKCQPILEVSADMFPIESDLEEGVYHVY
jgi:hypothetical protein